MSGRIEGRNALVTGAASGLGEAIARRFAAEGARVCIADIDASGEEVARSIGGAAFFQRLDVTDAESWAECLAAVGGRWDGLDILVNNAGITTTGNIETITLEAFRHELEVDLVGPFLGCKLAIPLMRGRNASVINMSSMASMRARDYLVAYNTAKAAVTMLTKSVALHYAKAGLGIRCNSIHPGVIRTPILDKVLAQVEEPEALFATWVRDHPVGRVGTPDEVARLALYLASDDASFATGAEFVLDGGSSL